MFESLLVSMVMPVALLAEGVDRNSRKNCISPERQRSPSSRRAWIEIGFSASSFRQ